MLRALPAYCATRTLAITIGFTALLSHSAWALEYKGVTGSLATNADSKAQIDAACAALYSGSRAASFAEMRLLQSAGTSVSTTAQTLVLQTGGNIIYPEGYGEYFADGLYAGTSDTGQTRISCSNSTSNSARGPAIGSTGSSVVSCGSASAWHCVSGDLAGGGSGDNLGNHTATQALNMGGFAVNSASGYFHSSDAALKANISKLSGWEILKHITGYSYDWKNGGGKSAGVLAQEVEKVMPSAVVTDKATGTKSVEYDQLIAPMIEAIKELKAENEAIREDNREMREEIKALKRQD